MPFSVFLETIPRILSEKYPSIFRSSPGEALSRLLQSHFYPLYKRLDDSSQGDNKLINEVDMDCEIVFTEVYSNFKDLYIVLFPWELRKDITTDFILNRSQRSFQTFARDFDISPGLLNKNQVTKI